MPQQRLPILFPATSPSLVSARAFSSSTTRRLDRDFELRSTDASGTKAGDFSFDAKEKSERKLANGYSSVDIKWKKRANSDVDGLLQDLGLGPETSAPEWTHEDVDNLFTNPDKNMEGPRKQGNEKSGERIGRLKAAKPPSFLLSVPEKRSFEALKKRSDGLFMQRELRLIEMQRSERRTAKRAKKLQPTVAPLSKRAAWRTRKKAAALIKQQEAFMPKEQILRDPVQRAKQIRRLAKSLAVLKGFAVPGAKLSDMVMKADKLVRRDVLGGAKGRPEGQDLFPYLQRGRIQYPQKFGDTQEEKSYTIPEPRREWREDAAAMGKNSEILPLPQPTEPENTIRRKKSKRMSTVDLNSMPQVKGSKEEDYTESQSPPTYAPGEFAKDSEPVSAPSTLSLSDHLTSDNIRSAINARGMHPIDSKFIVNFDGSRDTLQRNLYELATRLKSSYPQLDTLPYDVWKSENMKTLKTWLKILVSKWENRFEQSNIDTEDPLVKRMLDEMVQSHELDAEASERMAVRFKEVFKRRNRISGGNVAKVDEEELDAELGSWLRQEENATDNEAQEHEEVPDMGLQKRDMLSDKYGVGSELSEDQNILPNHQASSARSAASGVRSFSTYTRRRAPEDDESRQRSPPSTNPLPHLTPTGSAHMVSVTAKATTHRTAVATGHVTFTNPQPLTLIRTNSLKKGDVLSVARIAGIQAAKLCPTIIPLAHPINLTHVSVTLHPIYPDSLHHLLGSEELKKMEHVDAGENGKIVVEARVECKGETGVEMEALTAVMGAGLTVVDMCKAVDKHITVGGVRMVYKSGGRSGTIQEEGWKSIAE